jgi:UDP-glucose 6-dehydrogenase
MRISVIGTGYLGTTHVAGMAELGFEVVGVDHDAEKIAALAGGRLPFHEPGLQELIRRHVGSFHGVRVAVLGAAFKPDSDDVRDSPALEVARRLGEAGAHVTVYDPAANLTARAVAPRLRFAANASTACRKADLVLHLTEWEEFRRLDPEALGNVVRRKVIVDARNVLDVASWQAAGWVVQAPGRHISLSAGVPERLPAVDSPR